jgi:hypothetical protein
VLGPLGRRRFVRQLQGHSRRLGAALEPQGEDRQRNQGVLQRSGQGFVEPSRGLDDPNLSLSALTGVQLAPTSPKLVEGEMCELLRLYGVLRSSHATFAWMISLLLRSV